jgi:hypothetical protein
MPISRLADQLVSYIKRKINGKVYEMKAVHPSDRKDYLKSIGVLKRIRTNDVECAVCGSQISVETIRKISSKDGDLKFVCNDLKCNLESKIPANMDDELKVRMYQKLVAAGRNKEVNENPISDNENENNNLVDQTNSQSKNETTVEGE